MKQASGSTWTLQMMIIFILIFSAFLALVLTYSKAYTVKNRIITVFEKYEGATDESIAIINDFIKNRGYSEMGSCPGADEDASAWYGVTSLDGDIENPVQKNTKYYYCFREKDYGNGLIYYDIYAFYKFKLPIIGNLLNYKIHGETKAFSGNPERITN